MVGAVQVIDPLADPRWDDAVAGSPAELFITRSWLATIGEVFGLTIQAVVERDAAGSIVALVPFCAIDDQRGQRVSILPFSDFTVPVLPSTDRWSALIDPILDLGFPVRLAGAADAPAANDDRFIGQTTAVRQSVALDAPIEELTQRFAPHHRRLVRKAERAGIEFRCAESAAELRAFYELHLGVRRDRYRMLAQPYRLFEQLWQRFVERDLGALIVGVDGDTVAGGCLLLQAGDTLYYKYAASHPGYRSVGASHGAVAAAMALGIERGLTHLDLGRSDLEQDGLVDFKRRFGAEATELTRFTSVGADQAEPAALDGLLSELTRLFTEPDVPLGVTEQAGNTLYRLFA